MVLIMCISAKISGLPRWHSGKEYGRRQFRSLSQEDPLRRKWQSIPLLLPGKVQGQRSLAGYSPWGHKESDKTEHAAPLQQTDLDR